MRFEFFPPTSNGVMKSPSVSENVKMEPATRPGSASGSTTLRRVRPSRAPRSLDASMNESGIRSSAVYTGMIMNGSQMYENTSHIAVWVYEISGWGKPTWWNVQSSVPFFARITIQA